MLPSWGPLGRGSALQVKRVRCESSGVLVPKDKAIKRFIVRNIVDASAIRDIQDACAIDGERGGRAAGSRRPAAAGGWWLGCRSHVWLQRSQPSTAQSSSAQTGRQVAAQLADVQLCKVKCKQGAKKALAQHLYRREKRIWAGDFAGVPTRTPALGTLGILSGCRAAEGYG